MRTPKIEDNAGVIIARLRDRVRKLELAAVPKPHKVPTPPEWQDLILPSYCIPYDYTPQAILLGPVVVLRGGVQQPSGINFGTGLLATIPEGLRPVTTGIHVAVSVSTTGARTQAASRVWIETDGTISALGDQDSNLPPWVSFAGITFCVIP